MQLRNALRLFHSNHSKSEIVFICLKLLKHPRKLSQFLRFMMKKDLPAARQSLSWVFARSGKKELKQGKEKIETEISSWIRAHGKQSNSMTFTFLIPIFRPNLVFLEELIEVVQDQTYPNWEVLFVADGIESANLTLESEKIKKLISQFITTQTGDTASSFAAGTFKLLILSENIGTCLATFNGIANANGSHIVFVDQDDLISPNTLEVFSRLGQGEFDAAYSDHCVVDFNGTLLQTFRKPDWSPILATQVM